MRKSYLKMNLYKKAHTRNYLTSLVSNENFSKTLWPSGWALGQAA